MWRTCVTRLDRLDRAAPDAVDRRDVARDRRATCGGFHHLAEQLGMDRPAFKLNVRKLKALGLTESLEVGYRLSPRGAAFLAAAERTNPGGLEEER